MLARDPKIPIITIHQPRTGIRLRLPASLEDRVFPTFWSVKKGNIEEEKRLFYVAITRAKKRLYLSWHQGIGNQRYAPSRFLQSLDSQYIEVR